MDTIEITKRVTSPFLQAIPPQVEQFDAYLYAVVARKSEKIIDHKFGKDVRIDPATFSLSSGMITIRIPLNINHGIESIDDLCDGWFEAVEAAFLSLIYGCLP